MVTVTLDSETLSVAFGATKVLLEGIKQAHEFATGRRAGKQAGELGVRIWGSLLFEMRTNCDRACLMVQHAEKGGITFGTMNFSITDALTPDFCRLVVSPIVLSQMQLVTDALRRIDFYQRAAGLSPGVPIVREGLGLTGIVDTGEPKYGRAIAFADDLIKKRHLGRFNLLREQAYLLGREVFAKKWDTLEAEILPIPIALDKPVPGENL